MDTLLLHLVGCCTARTPGHIDVDDSTDVLASCMEQLHVGDSRSPWNSSCRSPCTRSSEHGKVTSHQTASPAAPSAPTPANTGFPRYRIFTFDIEATGLSPSKDAIIELAVVDVASGASWSSLVKPHNNKKSSRMAYAAHGISHMELQHPDVPTLTQALQQLWSFISKHTHQHLEQHHSLQQVEQQQHGQQQQRQGGAVSNDIRPLLIAHNGYTYDFKLLAAAVQSQQSGSTASSDNNNSSSCSCSRSCTGCIAMLPGHLLVFDTLALSRRLKLKALNGLLDLKQATLRAHFLGSPPSVAHRALADAQELAALLPHLLTWAAAQTRTDMDEKILPRTFHSFIAAAAAASADVDADDNSTTGAACMSSNQPSNVVVAAGSGAAAGVTSSVAVVAAASSSSSTRSSSSSRGGRGSRTAASAGRSRGRRAGKTTAAAEVVSSSSSNTVVSVVSAVAAGGLHSVCEQQSAVGSNDGLLELDSSSAAAAAAAAVAVAVEKHEQVSQCTASSTFTTKSRSSAATAVQISACTVAAAREQVAASSSSSVATISTVHCSTSAMTQLSAPAAAADSQTAAALQPSFITLKGRSLPIMSSTSFINLVQNTLSNGSCSRNSTNTTGHCSSSSSSGDSSTGFYLGPFIPGRSDPRSGFSDVLVGPSDQGLPVVFLMEGLIIAKDVKLSYSDGRVQAVSLYVKCSSRQRVAQQHFKQVAAAVNSIADLVPPAAQQRDQHHDAQLQQQQQQQIFSCLSGASLHVKIPVRFGAPYLDVTVRQYSSSSGSGRLAPVATPNLAAASAVDQLQQLFAVGSAVSVVLWPSCVWSNSKYRGVTLNCVEVWKQEVL